MLRLRKIMAKMHKWTFTARFKSGAYGWRGSGLATKRLREAVTEIRKAARGNPALGGEGAVALMSRL
jgi:hypothetical protein